MTSASIILICHDAPFGKAMAAALERRFGSDLVGVLAMKREVSRFKEFKRRLKTLLTAPPLERRVKRVEVALARAADLNFHKCAAPPDDWPQDVPVFATGDPNSLESVAWLEQLTPDIIAVTGAPILRAPVFRLARMGTLNMHSSLLPAYRGTQAEFWQVLEGQLHTCGLTIHFIDEGVDTGQIIYQRVTPTEAGISPQMLRSRNLIAALDVMPAALANVIDGTANPRPQGLGEPAKRSRDKTLERRAALLARLGYAGMTS